MNGDVLTDLDFGAFHDEHVSADRLFTISSHRREHRIDYGVLVTGDSESLSDFQEKPTTTIEVSMGVYMVDRRILEFVPRDRLYGFDGLMRDLLAAHRTVCVKRFGGYWLDIGRPDDYMQAIEEFAAMRSRFLGD